MPVRTCGRHKLCLISAFPSSQLSSLLIHPGRPRYTLSSYTPCPLAIGPTRSTQAVFPSCIASHATLTCLPACNARRIIDLALWQSRMTGHVVVLLLPLPSFATWICSTLTVPSSHCNALKLHHTTFYAAGDVPGRGRNLLSLLRCSRLWDRIIPSWYIWPSLLSVLAYLHLYRVRLMVCSNMVQVQRTGVMLARHLLADRQMMTKLWRTSLLQASETTSATTSAIRTPMIASQQHRTACSMARSSMLIPLAGI